MEVIFDAEFDSLTPTRIWCIVCKDIDTGEKYVFRFDKEGWEDAFEKFSRRVSRWVGLNNLSFDNGYINYLLGRGPLVNSDKSLDLLIVSRLVWYSRPGGHSVKAWGKRFGMEKPEIKVYDDPKMIDEYVNRCEHDVEIQHRIYLELLRHIDNPEFKRAIDIEHKMQLINIDMNENGFAFDIDKAKLFLVDIRLEMSVIEVMMGKSIPLVLIQDAPLTLRINKDGTTSRSTLRAMGAGYDCADGSVWYRFHYVPFSPGSSKQRVELLNKSGWKPTEKTKSHIQCERDLKVARWKGYHKDKILKLEQRLEKFKIYGWKVNEQNLETLPLDSPAGARLLATWLSLEGRRADVVEWCDAYNENSGRIHGTFNGIGAWTHRMSHTRPNQGNIFSEFYPEQCIDSAHPTPVEDVKLRFNGVLRGLWKAEDGAYLLGCDAEGIQMRILAHYINDLAYTRTIIEGRKEDKTDVHNLNRRLLGNACRSRDDAKTFIYAWLLGAGLAKVAQILQCSNGQARRAVQLFIEGVPGLAKLKRGEIPRDARRGYFVGLDGRKVIVPGEHYVLAGYLQNGESLVMKHANVLWRKWADILRLEYKQVDFVHDEWQTEVVTKKQAHILGALQCKAITQAGVDLGVRCALAGDYKIGRNWRETH